MKKGTVTISCNVTREDRERIRQACLAKGQCMNTLAAIELLRIADGYPTRLELEDELDMLIKDRIG